MDLIQTGRILAVSSACILGVSLLVFFHKFSIRRFQYAVFSARLMLRLLAGVLLLVAGGWAFSAPGYMRDELGTLFFTVGGFVLWWSLSQNFIRIGVLYGSVATILQLLLIAVCGPAVALVGMSIGGFLIVAFSVVAPVFVVVNRRARA